MCFSLNSKRNGKKVLVFSQSRYALDRCEGIAKKIFDDENQVTRIDGNVSANMRHDRHGISKKRQPKHVYVTHHTCGRVRYHFNGGNEGDYF